MPDIAKAKAVQLDLLLDSMQAAKDKVLAPLKDREQELAKKVVELSSELVAVRKLIADAEASIAKKFGGRVSAPSAKAAPKNGARTIKQKATGTTRSRRSSEQVEADAKAMGEKIVSALKALHAKDKESARLVTEVSAEISGHPSAEQLAPGVEHAMKKLDVKRYGIRRGARYYLT